MAIRGAKPHMIEDRIRRGNPSGHRLPEPVLVGGRPEIEDWSQPPEHLPEDAKAVWVNTISTVIEAGVADHVDLPALEGMALAYSRAREAARIIDEEGMIAEGYSGQPVQHPAVKIERDSWRAFLNFAEQFGITPIARTRLGLAEVARRSMKHDLEKRLGTPELAVIDGDS